MFFMTKMKNIDIFKYKVLHNVNIHLPVPSLDILLHHYGEVKKNLFQR